MWRMIGRVRVRGERLLGRVEDVAVEPVVGHRVRVAHEDDDVLGTFEGRGGRSENEPNRSAQIRSESEAIVVPEPIRKGPRIRLERHVI